MNSFELLLDHIDRFIRKFYKNQMVKGAILFLTFFLLSYLLTITLEYFGRFGSVTRAILFFSFIGINLYLLIGYLILPLAKLYSFGKRIDRYQAADIIGNFFPEISDRLRNTLQLKDSLEENTGNIELIRASVVQRADSLSVIPFSSAIDIRENRKYAKYLIPLFLLFVLIGAAAPELFSEGTKRVVNYSKEFKPEAPFKFVLLTSESVLEEGESLPVKLRLDGKDFPDNVYVISENGKFLLKRTGKNTFEGVIQKPSKSGTFHFEANEFTSRDYPLEIFGKSVIGKLQATLSYPTYLGREQELIENAGDMTVPEGTQIEWSIKTKNTQRVKFFFNGSQQEFFSEGFKLTKKIREESKVNLVLFNKFKKKTDSTKLTIAVLKDAYPSIQLEEFKDSIADGVRFFSGRIADDYGLTGLNFVYTIVSENGAKRTNRLSVKKVSGIETGFDFAVDFRRENLSLKDRVEYYFVVSDNDGVNGSKSTKSQTFTYKLPSLEELNEQRQEEQEQSKESLEDILKRTQQFQKNVDKLKKEVMGSKNSDWNKLNKVEQLKEEQNQILQSLEQLKQQMENSVEEKNQLSEMDKELLEKQEMLEKLLDEVMDDELKKLLDELEKLMKENNKDMLKEKLDDLEQNSEDMKKQLDRSMEMLKRLQVNEKIDDIEKELQELSKEQEELRKDVENQKLDSKTAEQKQESLNEKFKELQEDLDQLKELNKALEDPMELGNTEEQEKEISDEMQQASDKLGENKTKKAGENQKNASDKMKSLAEQLEMMQQMSNQQQQEEDINSLRNILESLMSLSFDQELVMQRFGKVGDTDPAYRRYGRKQRQIIDETLPVRDSLLALAKRQPKIASFVDKELNTIEENHELILDDIDEHRRRDLGIHQQSVMTAYNNLALLLNESLQSMQQQMQQSMMQGQGSCSKPGGNGKPKSENSMSMGDMKQMLKKQLQQMEKGNNPNGNKPGQQPGGKLGEGGMGMPGLGNKEIAKMAAEQTAIRQRLEQLRNEMNKEGKGSGNQLNPLIKELEQQEKELVNKLFTNETLKRQKDILTRLLESEKALMERGYEEKRESTGGKNENYGNQIRFEEYNRQKLKQVELLRSVDPVFRKYYKDKASEYFNKE